MFVGAYNYQLQQQNFTQSTPSMSTPNPNPQPFIPSKQHLLNLIVSKQYKSYKLYIHQLQRQNQSAQTAIVQTLSQIFIARKYRLPSTFFNALVLYKHLVVSAVFDFLCEDALFPQKIHRQIGQICRYRGKEKDLQKRGSDYFKVIHQIPESQQASTYGYNYILLALELIKSMANIYPSNYLDPSQKSIFKDIYDKLIAEEVFFPKEEQFVFIKEKDRVLFLNNYEKFKKYVEAMLQEEDKEKKYKGGKEDKGKKQTTGKQRKEDIKDSSNILELEALPLMSKIVSKKKEEHSPLFEPYQFNTLNIPTPQFISSPISSESSEKAKTSKIDKGRSKNGQGEPQPMTLVRPIASNQKREANLSQQIDRRIQSQKLNVDKKGELAHQILSRNGTKNNPIVQTLNQSQHSTYYNQIPKHYQSRLKMSRTQNKKSPSPQKKHRQNTQHHLQTSKVVKKDNSHRSLPKTQRRTVHSTPNKTDKNFKPSNQLPKDQKVWVDNNRGLSQTKFVSVLSQKLHQTLSQSSSKRRELNLEQPLSKYLDLTRTFNCLDIAHCTLNPNQNKYKPLRLNMLQLRDQALRLPGDGQANPFYRGDLIEARLIKEGKYQYRLSLRNMSQNPLIVAYKDMSSCRYSCAVRVNTWAGKCLDMVKTSPCDYSSTAKQQNQLKSTSTKFTPFISHSLSRHSYLDIKFTFFLTDPTFKFLPFDLSINGHDFFLILPLTLLDMTIITPSITPYFLQRYGSQGMILKTVPFTLRTKCLPSFLGSFQFKEFYPKNIDYWHNTIIGGCQMQIPSESYLQTINKQIYMLVRLVSYPKKQIEILAVYHLHDKEQQKFSKQMLQLLVFLLRQGQNI